MKHFISIDRILSIAMVHIEKLRVNMIHTSSVHKLTWAKNVPLKTCNCVLNERFEKCFEDICGSHWMWVQL